jgi:hypothetical protein
MISSEDARAAALIRDHIEPLVRAKGHAKPVGPTSQIMWDAGPFRCALRTVLSPDPLLSDAPSYAEAQGKMEANRMLPNGLEIWRNEKVLSIEWRAAELKVIRFVRGPWEQEALMLSAESSAPEDAARRHI